MNQIRLQHSQFSNHEFLLFPGVGIYGTHEEGYKHNAYMSSSIVESGIVFFICLYLLNAVKGM